jgi:hypothetical protein
MSQPSAITRMIEEVIADGKLTTEEKKRLDALLLEDGQLSAEERQALADLLTRIANGEVIVAD